MEWLPDLASADYSDIARVPAPRVAEIIAVHWPQPDGLIYYVSTATAEVFRSPNGDNLLLRPYEIRFRANQFLDLTIEDGISDSKLKLEFWDVDGRIADLHHTHGAGARVTVFYWFPDQGYLVEQWHGHLDEPEEEDGETFTVTAYYGHRSALMPLPNREFWDGCQAIYPPGRIFSQAEIDDNDCDVNHHIGGAIGNPALGDCPRRNHEDCIARRGNADRFLGFNTLTDSYPNARLISVTRGNNNNLKRPLRVVYGPYVAKDLDLLGFAVDENTNHPDQGWVWCLYAVSEGEVESITEPRIDNKFDGLEHFRWTTGARGQARPDPPFSPNVGNYSGTALMLMRVRGDYRNATGSGLPGQCKVGRRTNIRQWTSADAFTDGPTFNRAWVLLDALRNRRWGYGLDPARLVLDDWIKLAAWCDETVEFADAAGVVSTTKRSEFVGELLDKTAARHIYEICLAGNFSLPFPHRGQTRILGLSQAENLDQAPVFTDQGEARNILLEDDEQPHGKSSLTTWKSGASELANRVKVTFRDRALDNEQRPLIFEDVDVQLKAGRTAGDHTRRRVEKSYDLLGVDDFGQAVRLGNLLLDLGPLAGTTDEGPGLKNNRLIRFRTWFTQTLHLHKYKIIKVVSPKLKRYGFEYFRISKMTRQRNLRVEIEAVAYPVDYHEQTNALMLSTGSLPDGGENAAYSQTLQAAGGFPAYAWAVTSGILPNGLTLNPNTGALTGTPTAAGTFTFDITVTDSQGRAATVTLTITIAAAPPPPPPPPPGGGGNASGLTFEVTDATLPISIGVPVPEATNLLDLANLRLKNASGTLVPAAFAARVRWRGVVSDAAKAVKILAVDFTPNGTGVYSIESGTGNPAPATALTVTNNASDVQLVSGGFELKIKKTGTDLLSSLKLSNTAQLGATLPALTALVPVKSRLLQNSGVTGSAAANVGQNFVTVENAGLFSVGQQIKFQWQGKFGAINNGVPKALTFTTDNAISTGANEFTPAQRFIFDRGGANEFILTSYQYIWPTGFFARTVDASNNPTDGFPAGMPANATIEDKDALDAGTYTISAINATTGVITLTSNLTYRLLKNTEVVPASVTAPATATFEAQSATIVEQNALRAVVKQSGFFKLGGTRMWPDLTVELYWHCFAGHAFARVQMMVRNANQTMPANVRDAQFGEWKFNLPTATVTTASSDEVTAHSGAGSACARRLANTSPSTAVAGALKFTVAELAENYPSKLVASGSQIEYWPFAPQAGGVSHLFWKDRAKVWDFYLGANADTAAALTNSLRVKLDVATVAASGVFGRAIAAPKTWTASDFNGDAEMAAAANRFERMLRMAYDLDANDTQAAIDAVYAGGTVPRMSLFERDTSNHTQTGNNDFGLHFGWYRFGNRRDAGDGFTQDRYDGAKWLLLEWLRRGDARAFRLGAETARWRLGFGTIHSALPNAGNNDYNQLGLSPYEKSTDGINTDIGKTSHFWSEGLWLYWALTGDVIANDVLTLRRDAARRFISSGLAEGGVTGFNEARWLSWPANECLHAWRYRGDVADLNHCQNALNTLKTLEMNQGNRGVYVATNGYLNYNDPAVSDGTQCYLWAGYPSVPLSEYLLEKEALGTPDVSLQSFADRVARWLVRGLASNTAANGNQPVLAPITNGATSQRRAQALYRWFAGGTGTSATGSVADASLCALALLLGGRYGKYADVRALAREVFKAVACYRDSDANLARPLTPYDVLSFRNPYDYGAMLKRHWTTLIALFPFLHDAARNVALNPPTLTSVTPVTFDDASAPTLTITGTGFVTGAQVSIGGYLFTPANVTATTISLTIAANLFAPGAQPVLLTNPNGGQSNLLTITIT